MITEQHPGGFQVRYQKNRAGCRVWVIAPDGRTEAYGDFHTQREAREFAEAIIAEYEIVVRA